MSYLRPCLNKTMKNKTKSQNKRGYLMFIMVNFTLRISMENGCLDLWLNVFLGMPASGGDWYFIL